MHACSWGRGQGLPGEQRRRRQAHGLQGGAPRRRGRLFGSGTDQQAVPAGSCPGRGGSREGLQTAKQPWLGDLLVPPLPQGDADRQSRRGGSQTQRAPAQHPPRT